MIHAFLFFCYRAIVLGDEKYELEIYAPGYGVSCLSTVSSYTFSLINREPDTFEK